MGTPMRRSPRSSGARVRDRPVWLLLAGLLTLAALAGCTTSQAGQAISGDPPPSRPSTTSGSPSARVSVPPRPAELRLDGVDPCALFTNAQLAQLQVDRKRPSKDETPPYEGMALCAIDSTKPPFDNYFVTAVTNEGVEAWFTGKRNVQSTLSSVAGFGAATFWISGAQGRNADACVVSVDVAAGQQLMVDFDNDSKQTYTLEQLCQKAEQAAGMAVQNLRALK